MSRKLIISTIIAVIILGAGLRIWGIGWGLPTELHYFSYHPDETLVLLAATEVNFFRGQLDPGFYNYGSLFIYLASTSILLTTSLGFIDLSGDEIFANIGEFAKLYTAGRAVALILGIATIYLVYALGKRAYGRGAGMLAVLFMAVVPIHVMHSKFLAVDVPATFFTTLALLFAVRITDGHRLRDYLLSGLFAGLAAGTKYNVGLVILAPIAAHLATGKARPILRPLSLKAGSILVMAAIGFLIGTPGVLINYSRFSSDFAYEMFHASTGHGLVFAKTAPGFIYHFTHSLAAGMGIPLLALAAIGLLYAFRRRTPADLVLLVFLITYYALIGAAQVKFARYTIPILPILVVLAARVSADLAGRLMRGRAFSKSVGAGVVLVVSLVVGYTVVYSLSLDRVFASTDTRDRAAVWVRENIPEGASIGLPTIPWFYTPPLDPRFGFLSAEERLDRVKEVTEYVLLVSQDGEWDTDFLTRALPDYVILSEFEYEDRLRIRDSDTRRYFDVLERDYYLMRRFTSGSPTLFGRKVPCAPELPHDMSYASPTILIYARKTE